jgi:hypothetical protein
MPSPGSSITFFFFAVISPSLNHCAKGYGLFRSHPKTPEKKEKTRRGQPPDPAGALGPRPHYLFFREPPTARHAPTAALLALRAKTTIGRFAPILLKKALFRFAQKYLN